MAQVPEKVLAWLYSVLQVWNPVEAATRYSAVDDTYRNTATLNEHTLTPPARYQRIPRLVHGPKSIRTKMVALPSF